MSPCDETLQPYTYAELQKLLKPPLPVYVVGQGQSAINEGGRNNQLTKEAGHLRAKGLEIDEIRQRLQEMNKTQCVPPLSDAEVYQIARNAANWEPGTTSDHVDKSGSPRRPIFHKVHLDDFMLATNPTAYDVVQQWLHRRVVAMLGSHGGGGKTALALVIAAHVACGADFAGLRVTPGRVLFVSLEDEPPILLYRLRCIIEAYQLDHHRVMSNLEILDGTKEDSALAKVFSANGHTDLVQTAAYNELAEHAPGYDLIVIDNASDAFEGNENVRAQVKKFIRAHLGKIARDNDSAVLLLAHIDKNAAKNGAAGNSYSGSTAWHNSCRSRLSLVMEGGQLKLHHEKNNLGKCTPSVEIAHDKRGVPMVCTTADDNVRPDDIADVTALFKAAAAASIDVSPKTENGAYSAVQSRWLLRDRRVRLIVCSS